MSAEPESQHAQTAFRRILKNAGWLLGGKGFGAVSSLIYLAILSRSLGVKDFGHFSLIFGTAQGLSALAGFQTWQIIVRYGAPHVARKDWDAFGRLSVFGGVVDALGAAAGCLVAYAVIFGLGYSLSLNPQYTFMAFAFICAMLWARVSAPYGVIRALDRFELTVIVGAITPAGRLIAAIAIWLTGPSVARFLFAWAAIEFVTAAVMWITAWRLRPDALRLSRVSEWRTTIRENDGILKFLGITYCNTSLWAALQQGPLLAVAYFFGTSAAGVYRIADQLAKGLGKLAMLLSDAVYPEVNRQRHQSSAAQFRNLIFRVNVIVIVIGIFVVGLAVALGSTILTLIAGEAYAGGGIILVPLVVAASLELASVSYESVLHAEGKPQWQLLVRLIAVVVMAGAVMTFARSGTVGVGWGVAVGQLAEYVGMSFVVWVVLRRIDRKVSSA